MMNTRRLRSGFAIAVLMALLAVGCSPDDVGDDSGGTYCTLIGCGAVVSVQVSTPDGSWPVGDYELTVNADGKIARCMFALTESLDAPSPGQGWNCDSPLSAYLRQEMSCSSPQGPCSSLLGRQQLNASLQATPGRVQVELRRDGQLLLDGQTTPLYTESRPNGPACEPVCRQASVVLVTGGS